jgi:hypothetical protein
MVIIPIGLYFLFPPMWQRFTTKLYGSGGIRTHASEETGALNQRLRPLGHATYSTLFLLFYHHNQPI